jgi:hypothetical protein
MRRFERRRPLSTWANALPEVQGGRKAPSGHAAPACAAFPGWNTLHLGAHRACLRPGGDVTFEFGGHLAECLEIRAKVSRLLLSVARRAISSQWDVA